MNNQLSYRVSLAGLLCLALLFSRWLYLTAPDLGAAGATAFGATAPLALFAACWFRTRNWSGITALCMIPLAVIGVMDIVATLAEPNTGMAIGIISIAIFFCVLDAGRRPTT